MINSSIQTSIPSREVLDKSTQLLGRVSSNIFGSFRRVFD